MVQTTNANAKSVAEIEKIEAMKKRAARQAKKKELAPEIVPQVVCTVLPLGDGHISMGEHVAGLGEVHFEEGETFPCALPIAVRHYVRGWVSFEGAKAAVAEYEAELESQNAADRAGKAAFDRLMLLAGA